MAQMSSGQAVYYAALGQEDGHEPGAEPPGQWFGKGAERLGLTGEIRPRHFHNVFDGLTPDGSRHLVGHQRQEGREEHRPGWDMTFSAPKSVSVLWAQASPELRTRIETAHFAAVTQTLSYAERTLELGRMGPAGIKPVKSSLFFALFEHGASRALDPLLHTHALLLNVGVRPDGSVGTLNGAEAFRSKMLLGAYFRVELSYLLEQGIGLALDRKGSAFEVKGVPDALVKESSKRRTQIEAALDRKELDSPMAAAMAAIETRDRKASVPRAELFERWRECGERHGWTTELADGLSRRKPPEREPKKEVERAMADAIARIERAESSFTKRDITRAVLEECQARGVPAQAAEARATRWLERSTEVLSVGRVRGEPLYTTRDTLIKETELLRDAYSLQANARHQAEATKAMTVLSRHPSLTQEESKAVWAVACDSGGASVLSGSRSEKGKVLTALADVWAEERLTVRGVAPDDKAARRLERGTGIVSSGYQTLVSDLDGGLKPLGMWSVLVVDGAERLSTSQMARLAAECRRAGSKLVVTGDPKFREPGHAGNSFRALGEKLGRFDLGEPPKKRETVSPSESFSNEKHALIERSATKEGAIRSLLKAWAKDPSPASETLILAARREDVQALNAGAQAARRERGELGKQGLSVGDAILYAGDRVSLERTSGPRDIQSGEKGTVLSVHPEDKSLVVRLDRGGSPRRVEISDYPHVSLGYASRDASSDAAERAVYLLGGPSAREREFVSRHATQERGETRVFASDSDSVITLAENVRAHERERPKEPPIPPPTLEHTLDFSR